MIDEYELFELPDEGGNSNGFRMEVNWDKKNLKDTKEENLIKESIEDLKDPLKGLKGKIMLKNKDGVEIKCIIDIEQLNGLLFLLAKPETQEKSLTGIVKRVKEVPITLTIKAKKDIHKGETIKVLHRMMIPEIEKI